MASGYTQAQLDALKKAYTQGHSSVSHNGKKIDYRSPEELAAAIQTVERGLAADAGTVVVRQVRFVTGKGT